LDPPPVAQAMLPYNNENGLPAMMALINGRVYHLEQTEYQDFLSTAKAVPMPNNY
jgi:hypothetical protein